MRDTISQYTSDDSNTFKTIVGFDCRGLEPFDFSPRIGFIAEGLESGTKFNEVNLEEKEWVDYDEKSNQSVGVYELEYKFVTIK